MADNCAIYVSKKKTDLVDFFSKNELDAKINFISSNKKGEWEKIEISWPDLKLTINRMDSNDKYFKKEVEGLSNYIFFLSHREISNRTFMLLEKVQRTNHVLGIEVEPLFDNDKRAENVISGLASFLKAIVFKDFAVCDDKLKIILGKSAIFDIDARIPVFESSLIRKKKSEEKLKSMNIPLDPYLPPVISDEEVILQKAEEVAKRSVILLLLASRADGIKSEFIIKFFQKNDLWNSLSPEEISFLHSKKVEKQELINFNWRYETAQVLIWSLGLVEKLPSSHSQCNSQEIVDLINKITIPELVKNAKLRTKAEILDETDITYRMHWAVKNSCDDDLKNKIDSGVIYERHYAFNWLINFMNKPWDEISTNT